MRLFHLKQGNLATKNILKDKRVVISADGGRSRLIEYKGRKRNPKTNRRPYKGEWKEPKLLTIYAVDEKGKKSKQENLLLPMTGLLKTQKNS